MINKNMINKNKTVIITGGLGGVGIEITGSTINIDG